MGGSAKQKTRCGIAVAALFAASVALAALAAGGALAQDSQGNGAAPGAVAPAPTAPQPPALAPASSPPPAPGDRPGFLHQLKVWWDDSVALFEPKSETKSGPKNAAMGKDAAGAADGANNKPDGTGKGANDVADGAMGSAPTTTQDAMKNAVEATKGAAATATDAMKGAMEATRNAAAAIVRLPNMRVIDVHETCARAPNGASDCAAAAAKGCRSKGFNGGTPLDSRTAEKCDSKRPQAGQMPAVQCASETVVIRAVCQ